MAEYYEADMQMKLLLTNGIYQWSLSRKALEVTVGKVFSSFLKLR